MLLLAGPALAQQIEDVPNADLEQQSPAARFAIEAAEIAGGATFCEIEQDEVEIYIIRALMEIAALAADDVDLVVSRIVFSNIYSHSIARGPDLGCSAYAFFFQAQSNRISR